MANPGKSPKRNVSLTFKRNLALVFVLLGGLLIAAVTLHWFLVEEPLLRADAKSRSRLLAEAQAQSLARVLTDDTTPSQCRSALETVVDALLLLKDPATRTPFVRHVALLMDYDLLVLPPGSLDMERGLKDCRDCFVERIPIYHPDTGLLVGIATFHLCSQSLEQLISLVRSKLLWISAIVLILITSAWHVINLLLRRLGEIQSNLRSLFEVITFPMVLHAPSDGSILHANQIAIDYLGLQKDARGRFDSNAWRTLMTTGITDEMHETKEAQIGTSDGRERWALVSVMPVFVSSQLHQLISFVDISKNKSIQQELHRTSVTDALTGLYNRRYLFDRLAEEVSRVDRDGETFSIFLCDLDRFKQINDRFGHRVGDEVLTQVAATICHSIRDIDIAGRYGGEEFLVILPRADRSEAAAVAQRISANISAIRWFQPDLQVTVSGGISEYDGAGIDALIDRADTKLYEAKRAGRNRISR